MAVKMGSNSLCNNGLGFSSLVYPDPYKKGLGNKGQKFCAYRNVLIAYAVEAVLIAWLLMLVQRDSKLPQAANRNVSNGVMLRL